MKDKDPIIREITAAETLLIRHQVMWPNKPLKYVELPNDATGRHYGLFVNGEITSIISLFIDYNEAQFRKFATLIKFQGLGFGTILLQSIVEMVLKENIRKLWCNARVEKSEFYEKFGINTTNETFMKDGIEYVIMENVFTDKNNIVNHLK